MSDVRSNRSSFSINTMPLSQRPSGVPLFATVNLVLAFALFAGGCSRETAPDLRVNVVDKVELDDSTRAFLDDLQRRTFNWFWETTDPETGLVHDRYPRRQFSSIAATAPRA